MAESRGERDALVGKVTHHEPPAADTMAGCTSLRRCEFVGCRELLSFAFEEAPEAGELHKSASVLHDKRRFSLSQPGWPHLQSLVISNCPQLATLPALYGE